MSLWTVKAHQLAAAQARLLLELARDTTTDNTPLSYRVTPAGDERRLRGIPAIGRGVQGHIPGTRP